jgi:hypothetical protein
LGPHNFQFRKKKFKPHKKDFLYFRKPTMKFYLAALLFVPSIQGGTTDSKLVKVQGDDFVYSDGSAAVSITGTTCSDDATGVGTFTDGTTMAYTCLRTGVYEDADFAIACGTVNGGADQSCQAFRTGDAISAAVDGLVSSVVTCAELVANECSYPNGTAYSDCEFECSGGTDLCEAFTGLNFFVGVNTNNITYFNPGAGSTDAMTMDVSAKRLLVGDGLGIKWRKMSVPALCYYGNSIRECAEKSDTTTASTFSNCVTAKISNDVVDGTLRQLDYIQIMKVVDKANAPFEKVKKNKPKKKKPKKKVNKKKNNKKNKNKKI